MTDPDESLNYLYERAKAESALKHFFREQTLVALREIALRQAAHEVEAGAGHRVAAVEHRGEVVGRDRLVGRIERHRHLLRLRLSYPHN